MAEVVRRLGETGYGRNNGRVWILDLLACAGLLVQEGLVFTQRAHREFLQTSGVLLDIEVAARRGEDARGEGRDQGPHRRGEPWPDEAPEVG